MSGPELSLSSGRFGLIGLLTRPHQRLDGETSAQTRKTQAKSLKITILSRARTINAKRHCRVELKAFGVDGLVTVQTKTKFAVIETFEGCGNVLQGCFPSMARCHTSCSRQNSSTSVSRAGPSYLPDTSLKPKITLQNAKTPGALPAPGAKTSRYHPVSRHSQ